MWLDGEEFAIVNIKIHYNIVNNFGIYDRIESTIDEIKLFNVHGYCKVSISSIFINDRENYIIYMLPCLYERSGKIDNLEI